MIADNAFVVEVDYVNKIIDLYYVNIGELASGS